MQDYLEPKWQECAVCGERFDASLLNRGKGIHRYCGKKCRTRADNQRAYNRRKSKEPLPQLDRKCVICGINFAADAFHPNALTCSQKCNQARMDRVRRQPRAKNTDLSERACVECGTAYTPSVMSAHKQLYCSHKCAVRVAQRKLRMRGAGRPSQPRLKTAKWKEAARAAIERASGKCQSCVIGTTRLNVHHKFHMTEAERHDHSGENLIVLCGTCHRGVHDIQLGKRDGRIVISGLVFRLLGITEVQVVDERREADDEGIRSG